MYLKSKEEKISELAFEALIVIMKLKKYVNVDKISELKNLIITSEMALEYCFNIENDPEIRKFITEPFHAYRYCRQIDDDEEMKKLITDSESAYKYFMFVRQDPEMKKRIVDPEIKKELQKELAYWDDPENVKKHTGRKSRESEEEVIKKFNIKPEHQGAWGGGTSWKKEV